MSKCPKCGGEMILILLLVSKKPTNSGEDKRVPRPISRCRDCGFSRPDRRTQRERTLQPTLPMPKILF